MQIKIKTTNIELTSALSAYVEEKINSVEKFAPPHADEVLLANVEIGKTTKHHNAGEVYCAEVNITVRGKGYRAVSEKADLYAAIDDVRDEIARELNSSKERSRTLMRRGAGVLKNLIRFGKGN